MNNIEKVIHEMSVYLGRELCTEWYNTNNGCDGCPYTNKCRSRINALQVSIENQLTQYLMEEGEND